MPARFSRRWKPKSFLSLCKHLVYVASECEPINTGLAPMFSGCEKRQDSLFLNEDPAC
jgi:hypothetical protein